MSVGFTVDVSELDGAITIVGQLAEFDAFGLMSAVAALGESQTRRRITSEKTSPDGAAWLPNLEGTSILQRTGTNLLDSVAHAASATEAAWGASWKHAHVHQNGATIVPKDADALFFQIGGKSVRAKRVTIPARPFVGLSEDNKAELRELVSDFLNLGGLQ